MGEEFVEDAPLPALFERALELHNLISTSTAESGQIRRALALLASCQEKVDKLGLFSTNEEKEDIATADLKYLLVPYYLGDLTEKQPGSDRLQTVRATQAHLRAFIRRCDSLDLVPGGELDALTRDAPASAETKRSEKVARFKRQKAAEAKLQEIKDRKERRRRSVQATAKTSSVEHGEEDIPDEDDEEEREAQFAQISYLLCKAFDLVDNLKKEEDMLSSIQEVHGKHGNEALTRSILDERQSRAESWHKKAASHARVIRDPTLAAAAYGQDVIEGRAPVIKDIYHQPQPPQHRPLLFGPTSVIEGSMSTERERMVAEVFQPSHRLPTMSIEQAGLAEMELMTKWNEQNAKMAEEALAPSWHTERRQPQNDEDGSDDEAAEYKSRAWDDWKDENPRGAGNSSSKPDTTCRNPGSLAKVRWNDFGRVEDIWFFKPPRTSKSGNVLAHPRFIVNCGCDHYRGTSRGFRSSSLIHRLMIAISESGDKDFLYRSPVVWELSGWTGFALLDGVPLCAGTVGK